MESAVQPTVRLPPGTPPSVVLSGITKAFPGVLANAGIDLEVRRGEIHALLGENGAGKSTLMNILTGLYRPDAGEIVIDGNAVTFASPIDAIAAGIGMVHQHFKLVRAFTVAENIHLGWDETPMRASSASSRRARGCSPRSSTSRSIREPASRTFPPASSSGWRSCACSSRDARILILDEPTAVLTPAEAEELFHALRDFRASGNAVIFISHKLDEVLKISDRITVLRGGKKVATENTVDCNHRMLARLMVGRDIVFGDYHQHGATASRIEGADPVAEGGVQPRQARRRGSEERRSRPLCRRDSRRRRRGGQWPARAERSPHRPPLSHRRRNSHRRQAHPGTERRGIRQARHRAYPGGPAEKRPRVVAERHRQCGAARISDASDRPRPPLPARGSDCARQDHRRSGERLGAGLRHAGRQSFRRQPAAARRAARDAHRAAAARRRLSRPRPRCRRHQLDAPLPRRAPRRRCGGGAVLGGARGIVHPLRPACRPLRRPDHGRLPDRRGRPGDRSVFSWVGRFATRRRKWPDALASAALSDHDARGGARRSRRGNRSCARRQRRDRRPSAAPILLRSARR